MSKSLLVLLVLPALASAQDFWATDAGYPWTSPSIWQDGMVPSSLSSVSFPSCMGAVAGKIRIEEATSIGKINFAANARFAISDGGSLTFSSVDSYNDDTIANSQYAPISTSCESSTSGGEDPNASTGTGGAGAGGGGNTTLIVAVVAAVAVVLVAAAALVVVKKRKAAGGGVNGGHQMSFDNPMYDTANGPGGGKDLSIYHSALNDPQLDDDSASQYDEVDSGLNNASGYMDVSGAGPDGGQNTGGYMDVSAGATDNGYLDVEPDPEDDDDLGGDDV